MGIESKLIHRCGAENCAIVKFNDYGRPVEVLEVSKNNNDGCPAGPDHIKLSRRRWVATCTLSGCGEFTTRGKTNSNAVPLVEPPDPDLFGRT